MTSKLEGIPLDPFEIFFNRFWIFKSVFFFFRTSLFVIHTYVYLHLIYSYETNACSFASIWGSGLI